MSPREALTALWAAALAAVAAEKTVPPALPERPKSGRTRLLALGKAAIPMAEAALRHWPGAMDGVVVARAGEGRPIGDLQILEAAHPSPDAASERAGRRLLEGARGLGPDDLALALISGGGSSLAAVPAQGVSLAEKRMVVDALLRAGAPIADINLVRRRLSAIKGGRLAAAIAPARLVALIISDVPGDDPGLVASGPTAPDPAPPGAALAALARWAVDPPPAVRAHLRAQDAAPLSPGHPAFARAQLRLIARAKDALTAAAEAARRLGAEPVILGDSLEGEARALAAEHARRAHAIADARPASPVVLISGGELTVTVRGGGRGGPNTEYALALALALSGAAGVFALAADTDGLDGNAQAAGGFVFPDTLTRLAQRGINAPAALAANDSGAALAALGDLFAPGPTGTNVNDFRAIWVAPPGA